MRNISLMWFKALLCLSMCNPFMTGCWQDASRCGHVSMLVDCWLHNGQKMDGKTLGQKICFLQFPIYCPFLNLRVWEMCAWDILGSFQKALESVWSSASFEVHFWTEGCLGIMRWCSWCLCRCGRCVSKFRIGPVRNVLLWR